MKNTRTWPISGWLGDSLPKKSANWGSEERLMPSPEMRGHRLTCTARRKPAFESLIQGEVSAPGVLRLGTTFSFLHLGLRRSNDVDDGGTQFELTP